MDFNRIYQNILEMKWTYLIISFLVIVVIFLYFNKNQCPSPGIIIANEGYLPNSSDKRETCTENYQDSNEMTVDDGNGNSNGNNKVKGEIVLYYATWCGYSRMILPEWEKFEKFAQENLPYLKVTKFRCEGGDERTCVEKHVEGYPTVILYPKDNTEIQFKKERNLEKLIEFVNENL